MTFSTRLVGIGEALLSATFFGLIPVLFLPIYEVGISAETSLIYRFGIAAFILFLVIKAQKQPLLLPIKNHAIIILGALSYYIGALLFFNSLTFIPSSISVTIFFTNPIFVMLLMALFYKEKIEPYKIFLSLTTMLGIALFSGVFTADIVLNPTGMGLSVLASFSFACYIVSLFKLQGSKGSYQVLSFYLFMYCTVFACMYGVYANQFILAKTSFVWLLLFLSALVTAVLPNILLMSAMKKIGSVLSAILGVMDPITAVVVGVVVFGDAIDIYIISGIVIVLTSVMLITVLPMVRR